MMRLNDLLAMAKTEVTAQAPGTALFSYLQQLASQASAKHDLFDALGAAGFISRHAAPRRSTK